MLLSFTLIYHFIYPAHPTFIFSNTIMKHLLLTLSIFFCINNLHAQFAYDADKLMKRASDKDTLYIINFWATWCAPCVEEIHCFDTLQQRYAGKQVKVLLVSLDFKENYKVKIPAFIKKKGILPETVWFSETDANSFIPKIDNSWNGSIPATLVIQQGKEFRYFKEGKITVPEISAVVDKQLVQ